MNDIHEESPRPTALRNKDSLTETQDTAAPALQARQREYLAFR